jgi:anti-sigma factor ChrR (cupin superfamily)|tara:strand:- start:2095 stop:2661 length:567 start_codon:yes stop_codon:yes gene_type:complete
VYRSQQRNIHKEDWLSIFEITNLYLITAHLLTPLILSLEPLMRINADFSRRASLAPEDHEWVKSPQNGVERVMLDRIGEEKARATSLVRYAPNSYFPHHLHPGGEEILVLSGTFSADDTHYPAGWYVRNPPASGHRPYSDEGAVIFVKLRQMSPDEAQHVAIDTHDGANWQRQVTVTFVLCSQMMSSR